MEKVKWFTKLKNILISDIYFKVYKRQKFNDADFNDFINIVENSNNIISLFNIEFNYLLNFTFKRRYDKYGIIKNVLLRKIKECPLPLIDENLKKELNIIIKDKYSNGLIELNTCNEYILKYLDDESLLTRCILKDKTDISREISIYILATVIEDFAMNKEVEITKRILNDDINIDINNKLIVHVDPFLIVNKNKPIGQFVSSKNIIRLNELDVINLEYKNIKILDTIFHEIFHSVQLYSQLNDLNLILNTIDDEMRKENKLSKILKAKVNYNESEDFTFINYLSYMMKKENLLASIIGFDYYNELNYKLKFIEISARLNAHIELKKYLSSIDINEIYFYYKKVDIDKIITGEKINLNKAMSKKIKNEKSENLNDIFSRYLNSNLIEKYKFLNIEYNENCSLKNAQQLLNDLELKISKTNDVDKINKLLDLYYNLIINNYDKSSIIEYNANNKFVIDLKKKLLNL